jgi:hypothetical protein
MLLLKFALKKKNTTNILFSILKEMLSFNSIFQTLMHAILFFVKTVSNGRLYDLLSYAPLPIVVLTYTVFDYGRTLSPLIYSNIFSF